VEEPSDRGPGEEGTGIQTVRAMVLRSTKATNPERTGRVQDTGTGQAEENNSSLTCTSTAESGDKSRDGLHSDRELRK
jgi:hypothetical protein